MMHAACCRALFPVLVLTLAVGCGGGGDEDAGARGAGGAAASSPASGAQPAASTTFTEADLDAFARGLTKEIELVRAAQERQRTATTPEARGQAMRAQWEDQTIPEGARSAGMSPERYRQVRETVDHVLETLDFQGKIDGPKSMDTTNATPEMRRRLTTDPFAELPPASAAALRARMDRLVPLWVEYVTLTAVAG
jgi:hypothetical protein